MNNPLCQRCTILLNDLNPQQWGVNWTSPENGQLRRVCACCYVELQKLHNLPINLPPMPQAVAEWKPESPKEPTPRPNAQGPRGARGSTAELVLKVLPLIHQGKTGPEISQILEVSAGWLSHLINKWIPENWGTKMVATVKRSKIYHYVLTPEGVGFLRERGLLQGK